MPSGWYVVARDGAAQRTRWLLGPFPRAIQAIKMMPPVRHAINDPDLSIETRRMTADNLPPGNLDLNDAVDIVWINYVIHYHDPV